MSTVVSYVAHFATCYRGGVSNVVSYVAYFVTCYTDGVSTVVSYVAYCATCYTGSVHCGMFKCTLCDLLYIERKRDRYKQIVCSVAHFVTCYRYKHWEL